MHDILTFSNSRRWNLRTWIACTIWKKEKILVRFCLVLNKHKYMIKSEPVWELISSLMRITYLGGKCTIQASYMEIGFLSPLDECVTLRYDLPYANSRTDEFQPLWFVWYFRCIHHFWQMHLTVLLHPESLSELAMVAHIPGNIQNCRNIPQLFAN